MRKLYLFFTFFALTTVSFGQVTTTVNPTIAQITQKLSGNGITISGVVLTCPSGAYALYSGGTGALSGLSSGILLTTGSAANVQPSGVNQDYSNGTPGSAVGDNLDQSGNGTNDECSIKFMITPSCNTLSIKYVFASEEYPENVGGGVSDVFGFVIDGPNPLGGSYNQTNIALVPGTNLPVSIDNVNYDPGFPPFLPATCTNCSYYVSSPAGMVYDGSTTVLTASTQVIPCSQYTMTIGVWDVGDDLYDSGVFLDVNGISCVGSPTITAAVSPSTICGAQTVTLTAAGAAPSGTYTWSAPATGGLTATTGTVVTANPTGTTIYTLSYSDVNTCPGTAIVKTTTLTFTPPPALPVTQTPAGSICAGQTVTLTANGGAGTYSWSPGSSLTSPSSSITAASPTTTTNYTVTKTVGSCVSSTVITVSVSATPTTAITPSITSICAGQSQVLSASGTGPFTWTASSGANPPAAATVTVTPATTTSFTVVSGAGTCTSSAIATVSISTTPSINITPSVSTICNGQSQALSSSGAGPFTWTASSGANPTSAANVTVTPASTTTYTVLSGSGSCTATAVATVNVGPPSTIAITPSLTSICLGQSATLSASGPGPFNWLASSGTNPASAQTVTVTPGSTTTYTVISGTGACTAQAVSTVSITPTLSISVVVTPTLICAGQSSTLSVSGSSGPFVWTPSSGSNPSPTGTVVVSPTITTSYTVLAGTGACTAQAVANVSISPNLTVSISPSNTTVCLGNTATLTASGASSYTWVPGFSTGSTFTAVPTSQTTYTVIGTDGTCLGNATATINTTTITTTASSSSSVYCVGVPSVTLTGNGASTYSWSPSNGLSATSGSVVTASPTISTIYTVTGTSSGCTSSDTVSINVPPMSTVTASMSHSVICVGGTGSTLTASGAATYTWSSGSVTTPTLFVNPTSTTSYTVIGQTSQGCLEVPAVITVSVLPTINPTLTASSPTVCLTKTVSISSPAASGLTYTWQPVSAIIGASNTASIVASPPSTSSVIYTVTISNGVCIGTNTIQIGVRTPPIGNFMTLNNDTICTGGCVTFSSTTTGSSPIAYKWYYEVGVGTSSVGVAPEACYPSAGSFSVMMVAENACGIDTVVKNNFVSVFDYPIGLAGNDTTINIGESAEIFASGGLSYLWSPNVNGTIACPTCSNTVVQPTVTTQYIVVISNSIYCKVQDTVTVTVDVNCGDFFIPNVFSPNGDGLNDYINVHGRCISTFNLQIFNRWGEKVFETSSLTESWDGTFRGQKLDTGVFVYKADGISIDGQSFNLKGNITLMR